MSKNDKYCMVYVTCPTEPEAFRIAENAVQDKFAACANVSGKNHSVYWWEGVVQNSEEYAVWLKTTVSKYAELEHMIRKIHSYENPCIIMLDINTGSKDFLNWISETVNRK